MSPTGRAPCSGPAPSDRPRPRVPGPHRQSARSSRRFRCHLGGSSSITGILNGVAIGNSFGMSPQSGLPQNNRVGDLDPAALPVGDACARICRSMKLERQLTQRIRPARASAACRMTCGISSARPTRAIGARRCARLFVAAARHWIGAYFLALNGADAIVFTAGIGENSARCASDLRQSRRAGHRARSARERRRARTRSADQRSVVASERLGHSDE